MIKKHKFKFKFYLFLFVTLLSLQINLFAVKSENIIISEILPDPIDSDNNKEFVEIFGINNLSQYLIGDLSQNDSLEVLQINNSS